MFFVQYDIVFLCSLVCGLVLCFGVIVFVHFVYVVSVVCVLVFPYNSLFLSVVWYVVSFACVGVFVFFVLFCVCRVRYASSCVLRMIV